jgi:hypothetical protein
MIEAITSSEKESRMHGLRYPTKTAIWPLVLSVFVWASTPATASAMTAEDFALYWYSAASDATPNPNLSIEVLAKAEPDECFNAVACADANSEYYDPPPPDNPNVYDPNGAVPCNKNKVNQAYVWGLAKSGDDLWFGTAPNTHCLVMGGIGSLTGDLNPTWNESWACEFGCTQYENPVVGEPVPAPVGDWRPPRVFVYKGAEQELIEKTGLLPLADRGRLETSTGIRSAGTIGNVVILAGPSLGDGINLFAFNTETGAFIGSETLTDYSNIRKWLVVNGVLYTAVQNAEGGGSVLRYNGYTQGPFHVAFDVVGNVDAQGAELAYHEGRLFVSTWPEIQDEVPASLWMSPVIPGGGLMNADAGSWQKAWDVSSYEPDGLTALSYGGGALASFDGYLYWGTMHVPMAAAAIHSAFYSVNPFTTAQVGYPDLVDLSPDDKEVKAFLGTHRPINIFRGRNFASSPEIELVYGMAQLPKFTAIPDPPPPAGTGGKWINAQWNLVPNNMGGASPLYGSAGFNNIFNNYTWTMSVFQNQLYVGTMDFAYLLEGIDLGGVQFDVSDIPGFSPGADLYRFPSSSSAAIPENIQGAGNLSTYGVRTMISDDALYLGMANPMNLLTNDQGTNIGGWELLKLEETQIDVGPVDPNDPALGGDYDTGIQVNSGELAGAKIIYNSNEPVPPRFGPPDEVPPFDIEGIHAVAVPLNLQPSGTAFNTPVKVFIPCPPFLWVNDLEVYAYDGTDWIYVCDAEGIVQPGAVDLMVAGSRVNRNETVPSCIEVQFYHFTGFQAGYAINPEEDDTATGGTIQVPGGDGGGGCFVKATAFALALNMNGIFLLGLMAAAVVTAMRMRKAR